jgi:hypothetical protein
MRCHQRSMRYGELHGRVWPNFPGSLCMYTLGRPFNEAPLRIGGALLRLNSSDTRFRSAGQKSSC